MFHYAVAKEYAFINKVKNLILFYFESNDLTNLEGELKVPILKKMLLENTEASVTNYTVKAGISLINIFGDSKYIVNSQQNSVSFCYSKNDQ